MKNSNGDLHYLIRTMPAQGNRLVGPLLPSARVPPVKETVTGISEKMTHVDPPRRMHRVTVRSPA